MSISGAPGAAPGAAATLGAPPVETMTAATQRPAQGALAGAASPAGAGSGSDVVEGSVTVSSAG